MDFSFRKTYGAGVLALNGDLVSRDADELRVALMSSLCNSDRVVVYFDDITGLDITCVQTFCKANRKSQVLRKHLIFDRESLKEKIRQNGISCSIGCDMFGDNACLLTQS